MNEVQQEPSAAQNQAQHCSQCGAALAADQRYCLNCGTRRGPLRAAGAAAAAPAAAPQPPVTEHVSAHTEPRQSDFSPLAAVLGVALLGGMLLIGVLIGRGESDEPQQAAVVQLEDGSTATGPGPEGGSGETSAPGGGSGETSEPASEIVSEWPAGTEGFTVRLTSTPDDVASPEGVESLQADAESKGVSEVGVLDSDLYRSLPRGEWIVYSGIYTNRGDATTALSEIKSDFPDASVVKVSTTAPGPASGSSQRSQGAGGDVTTLQPSEGGAIPALTEPEIEREAVPAAPAEDSDSSKGGA